MSDCRISASAGSGWASISMGGVELSRNSVKDQVTPERPASPGTRQDGVPSAGIEPAARGLGNPASTSVEYD
jgi:hypothetical protein